MAKTLTYGTYDQMREAIPYGGGPLRPPMAKRVMASPMGKEPLAFPTLRPMGESGSLWP